MRTRSGGRRDLARCSCRPWPARRSGASRCSLTRGEWRVAVIGTFIAGVIALSLVVVTGYAGQVSLAQLALAGVGALHAQRPHRELGRAVPVRAAARALVATVVACSSASRAAAAGPDPRRGHPRARVRDRSDLVPQHRVRRLLGRSIDRPEAVRLDLSIGTGHAFPRLRVRAPVPVHVVLVAFGVARLRTSSLGSAMLAVRANERSAAGIGVNVVRVKVIELRHRVVHRRNRRLPLRLPPDRITFASSPRSPASRLLSTAYLAGITSVWGGITAGVLAGTGIVFFALDKWVDIGEWFGVISGVPSS